MLLFQAIIVVALFSWFSLAYARLSEVNKRYDKEVEKLKDDLSIKKRELNLKKAQMIYYNTDEYMEKIAREEADLVMPNDIVFMIEEK